jgi:lipid II:glycine glycyltransferase (peptidoglycan interpeptide bridge formation enzyme)
MEMGQRGPGSGMNPSLSWSTATRSEWDKLFADVDRSNLLQSWAYGEAKRVTQGWQVQRQVICLGGRPLALVQVLDRSVLGARVLRINRGPLWLGRPDDLHQVAGVFDFLRRQAGLWRARLLLIAPELPSGPPYDVLLREARFLRRRVPAFRSVRVDLELALPKLWRNLRKNWREQVLNSERAGVTVSSEYGDEPFDWLMSRHDKLMAERGFMSVSVDFVRAMRPALRAPKEFEILRASAGGAWVAGLLVFRHGSCATALVGWNGPEGRKLNANNSVYWQAMRRASEQGCRWIDFNHIDDHGLPGIANWKRGLGGAEYTLAGEYVCL